VDEIEFDVMLSVPIPILVSPVKLSSSETEPVVVIVPGDKTMFVPDVMLVTLPEPAVIQLITPLAKEDNTWPFVGAVMGNV